MHIDFKHLNQNESWMIINDSVMGGVSNSRLDIEDSAGVFRGILSLKNNGGFASIRKKIELNEKSDIKTVKIRVKGDGRLYQLRFRTSQSWDGIAYVSEFKTKKDEWLEFSFSADQFTPGFRGRKLRNVAEFQFKDIRQMGFLIGDKKPGKFELFIDSVIFE